MPWRYTPFLPAIASASTDWLGLCLWKWEAREWLLKSTTSIQAPSGSIVPVIVVDTMGGSHYYSCMILSFRDPEAEKLFRGVRSRRLAPSIQRSARRKLLMLDAATELESLRVPPGNRLEALRGDRVGQHSIRINGQWRICFVWSDGGAHDVEIIDYH